MGELNLRWGKSINDVRKISEILIPSSLVPRPRGVSQTFNALPLHGGVIALVGGETVDIEQDIIVQP